MVTPLYSQSRFGGVLFATELVEVSAFANTLLLSKASNFRRLVIPTKEESQTPIPQNLFLPCVSTSGEGQGEVIFLLLTKIFPADSYRNH